jgi:hypothetical protein
MSVQVDVVAIASDVWKDLVEASLVEPPLNVKPFYDEVIKVEDPTNNKVLVDFKRPSDLSVAEFNALPAKYNWNNNVKYSPFSINKYVAEAPIRLCHLLIVTAYKLKVFGDDAFGKVSSRCKIGAAVVNHLMEKNSILFPAGSSRSRAPVRARVLNEETFKATVVDMLRCTNDTNLQRTYVGDGAGDLELAGLGIAPIALTDGSNPSAEMLFKRCLHEVKALFESQGYLKNPHAPESVASRQQSMILDGIARIANGQSITSKSTSATATNSSIETGTDTSNNSSVGTPSPVSAGDNDEKKKKVSPAVAMAEASLLSQKAALKEANNFEALIALQKEELSLRQETARSNSLEKQMGYEERKSTSLVLQKIVDKLCPDQDPTDRFASRKRKLDELRDVLGDELYQTKLQQLKEEFLKASAL